MVCANAYIGAEPIADALLAGADIVVTGRVADPSLTVGPALAHFGWARDDWDRLARATMAGHLLECGAQVSGGYYADPGYKDIPDLAHVGYPIAEIDGDGHCTITKPPGTGGRIDEHTVKEQLLYEVHDPAAYLTPDVVADLREARVVELAPNRVRLEGVRGHARPATLKVNVFREQGWLAEGEISYAGARAESRARLAGEVLRERLADARQAAHRPDRRRQRARRRRRPLARRAASRRRPRRAPARRADPRRSRRGRAAAARSDRALHLRSRRRRRRSHRAAPAALDAVLLRAARRRADALFLPGPIMSRSTVPLHRVAHGRTGDKGNRSNISVIAWHAELWPLLVEQVTEERVAAQFAIAGRRA